MVALREAVQHYGDFSEAEKAGAVLTVNKEIAGLLLNLLLRNAFTSSRSFCPCRKFS